MKSSPIKRIVRFAIPVMTVGIFLLDWATPLGIVDWVLYFIPLLLSFYASERFSAVRLASIFSALTVAGFFLSPRGLGFDIALTNLFLGLFTLWVAAILVGRLRRLVNEITKMSVAVEQSPVSIVITDLRGAIEYVNPKFCAVTGYSFEEVRGKNPRLLKSGEMPAETYRQLWATIAAGEEWSGEFRNRKKNGEFYWETASISPIHDDKGNVTHFIAIKEDITERKRTVEALKGAEKELAESARQQKAMFDNIPDPAWMRDGDGRFLAVNPAWCRFAGITAAQAVGKSIAEIASLYSAEQAKSLQEEDRGIISSGEPSQRELRVTIPNHGDLCFATSKAPLLNEQGIPCGVVGIARDITERKRVEAKLMESKQFLQSALDALSAHIAILDEQGQIISVNAAWSQFGQQNNFLGRSDGIGADYLHLCESAVGAGAEEALAVAHGIRAVMAGQRVEFALEYPCHSPQEQRWFVVRVTRFAGEGPVRVVVAHENVTARKQAEDELQWKTAFLEAQVNSSIDGILVVDEQGRKKLQSQRTMDLLKIPRTIAEEIDGEAQLKWVTQTVKDPVHFIEKVRYLASHRTEISRDELELKDGTVLDRYSTPVIGRDGKYYGRMWTHRDITQRKRMEESLRKSEEKFRQLAENITDVFWMTSPDLRTVHYVSPAYERIWGRSMESLYSHPLQWIEAILPEDRPAVAADFSRLMKDRAEVSVEYRILRPDGAIRWIHDRGFQVRDTTGTLLRVAGIASDITERKQIADELAQHKENEERARLALEHEREMSRIKGQFVSMVSHEFRTPLCVINAGAYLLESYSEKMTVQDRAEQAREITRAVARMEHMMHDFLVHERLQSGKLECKPGPIMMDLFCREVIAEIASDPRAACAIECVIDPAAREAVLDETIMRHILSNLLSNAVKYSNANQTVTLEVKPAGSGGGPMMRADGGLQILVKDEGIGIPAADMAKLYQAFHRSANVGNRPGTGLGLAIVKKYVDLHRGLIRIESTEGKGTSVWVWLPAGPPDGGARRPAQQSQAGRSDASRIGTDVGESITYAKNTHH